MVDVFYFDTSALVKAYVNETGSSWVRELMVSESAVLVSSHLLSVEMISAFSRRLREGSVTLDEYHRIKAVFDNDVQTRFQIVRFDNAIVALARLLLEQHPLRTYDAIHLSSSLIMNRTLVEAGYPGLTFLCADRHLLLAAEVEGLQVADPNQFA